MRSCRPIRIEDEWVMNKGNKIRRTLVAAFTAMSMSWADAPATEVSTFPVAMHSMSV